VKIARTSTALALIVLTGVIAGPAAVATAAAADHATVKGTIVKESGNPLANTEITVGIGDCETPGGCGTDSVVTTKTDADGHYHASVLVTSNPNVVVSVPAKGPYLARSSAAIAVKAGHDYRKNLTVYKESKVVGKLTDAAGAPITAVVQLTDVDTNDVAGADVADAKKGGYFHLSATGGSYKLKLFVDTNAGEAGGVVKSWNGATTKAAATVVEVKPGADVRVNAVFAP